MSISDVMYRSEGFSRVLAASFGSKTLATPTYFPAISSFGLKHGAPDLVELLVNHSYPRLLISAYDLHHMERPTRNRVLKMLSKYSEASVLFLDSGMYESHWYRDLSWNFELYEKSVRPVPFDILTSLDVFPALDGANGSFTQAALTRILASREVTKSPGFTPVIHALHPEKLVSMVKAIFTDHPDLCNIVAIPERDCGATILDKAKTIVSIRKILNAINEDAILHILGCGHPKSLVLFSFCGADTFDSLDWVRFALDPQRLLLEDFSYLDMIDCDCRICLGKERECIEKVLLHNLVFYQGFMKTIRQAIQEETISELLETTVGTKFIAQVKGCIA